ncbi:MAG: hypothetical protein ABIH22_01980, partial [Candidatus Margulisiibacteriota bacterium]
MKRILFLEQFSQIGGGQKCLLDLLDGIDKTVYECSVALPGPGELLDELEKRNVAQVTLSIGKYSVGPKNLFDLIKFSCRSI